MRVMLPALGLGGAVAGALYAIGKQQVAAIHHITLLVPETPMPTNGPPRGVLLLALAVAATCDVDHSQRHYVRLHIFRSPPSLSPTSETILAAMCLCSHARYSSWHRAFGYAC
jgi:hypothetical protein